MTVGRRWLRFNAVGVLGFVLQSLTLTWLVGWAGVTPGVAIAIAVLAAVSHNFIWHEHVTWPDLPRNERFRRWVAFHLSTGVFSVTTNLVVTMLVVRMTALPVVPANVIAVGIASIASFWVSDRLVFKPSAL